MKVVASTVAHPTQNNTHNPSRAGGKLTCQDTVLDGEQAEQQRIDDSRLADGRDESVIDAAGNPDAADESDRVEESCEKSQVAHRAIADRDGLSGLIHAVDAVPRRHAFA
jgi:hypothetical protein